MTLKLKALGLGFFAMLAVGAVAVMNAGATVNPESHFTSDSASGVTTLQGSESTHTFTHKIEASAEGLPGEPLYCTHASYHGTVNVATTQTVEVTPSYSVCTTTPIGGGGAVTVHVNNCKFVFHSRSTGHATAGLACPTGKKIEITDPATGCKLSFGSQTVGGQAGNGIVYTTDTVTTGVHTKHSLTVDVTVKNITYTAHNGLCVFIATSQNKWKMTGSVTVHGVDPNNGNTLVNITAT